MKVEVDILLDSVIVIDHLDGVADPAAELRRAHRWRLPDAFQAAIAQHRKIKFATRNVRDFPPERFEFVVVPYTV